MLNYVQLISDFKDAINSDFPVLSELEIKQEKFELEQPGPSGIQSKQKK
jgi:hypothetical protein